MCAADKVIKSFFNIPSHCQDVHSCSKAFFFVQPFFILLDIIRHVAYKGPEPTCVHSCSLAQTQNIYNQRICPPNTFLLKL